MRPAAAARDDGVMDETAKAHKAHRDYDKWRAAVYWFSIIFLVRRRHAVPPVRHAARRHGRALTDRPAGCGARVPSWSTDHRHYANHLLRVGRVRQSDAVARVCPARVYVPRRPARHCRLPRR